jgi:tripeptide aminopeptidase
MTCDGLICLKNLLHMMTNSRLAERFMRYVRVDTQSDPYSTSFPSTEKQKDLSRILVEELHDMGITDAELDTHGYVYATIPSNTERPGPVICFCAHVDTSPDSSGKGVKPILHLSWDGRDIPLPDDPTQVIRVKEHPYLESKAGDDIITASGTTLLGADDKSGVAVVMELARHLMAHPELPHGKIRLLFTPDEEVGRGVDHVDLKKLGADFGYTLDGGELGSLEDENFSADGVRVVINGISAHPGFAKGKLVNAIKIAGEFIDRLPKGRLSPETTDDREGFFHPVHISGQAESATVDFIIRDFDTQRLKEHEEYLEQILRDTVEGHPGATCSFTVKEQYRNMKEVLDKYPQVTAHAEEAIKRAGLKPVRMSIRGGTDGSRLSFMGLPCPNLFTGEMNFHSRQEYVSVQDMEKALAVLVELVQIWVG